MEHGMHDQAKSTSGWSRGKIVLIAFLAIAGFYLVAEHRAHAYAVLPFLLLPACLLLHVFMHRGHGGHGGHGGDGGSSSQPTAPAGQPTPPPPPAT